MTVYRPDHQDWHDLLGSECTCDEVWARRDIVDERCWYHRTIDVLDDHDMGRLLDKVLYEKHPECDLDTTHKGDCFVQVYPEVSE